MNDHLLAVRARAAELASLRLFAIGETAVTPGRLFGLVLSLALS